MAMLWWKFDDVFHFGQPAKSQRGFYVSLCHLHPLKAIASPARGVFYEVRLQPPDREYKH